MRSELAKGLNSEAQQAREQQLYASKAVLDLYKQILEAKLADLNAELVRAKNYDSPNWALKQADYVGAARTLQDVISLLTLDRETK